MDNVTLKNAIDNLLEIFINPEIEKRKSCGDWKDSDFLWGTQIVINPSKDVDTEIRINQEIKAEFTATLREGKTCEKGQLVSISQIKSVSNFKSLSIPENCGYATILFLSNSATLEFDFRYNKSRVREELDIAEEFIESAEYNLNQDLIHPCVDNIYSSVEVCAKANVLPFPSMSESLGKHGRILSKVHALSKGNELYQKLKDKLNRFEKLRDVYRYNKHVDIKAIEEGELLETIRFVKEVIKESRDVNL